MLNSSPQEQQRRRPAVGRRLLLPLAGVVGFALVVYFSGLDQLPVLLDADLAITGLAFLALVGVTLVSTVRWGSITNALVGRRMLAWPGYYAALLTSRVLGLFVSRSGSDLGVRFVTVTGPGKAPVETAAASVILDQMFDLALLVAWLGPSLVVLSGDVSPSVGVALLGGATLLALAAMLNLHTVLNWLARGLSWTLKLVGRLPTPDRVQRFLRARRENTETLLQLRALSRPRLLGLAVLTFARYLLTAFMFFAIAAALGLGIPWHVYVLTAALVQLSLVVAATPGGLGIMDAGWVFALALAGVPAETTAAFVVGQRAFQYVAFPGLAGVSYLLLIPVRSRPQPPQQHGRLDSVRHGLRGDRASDVEGFVNVQE